MNLQERLLQNEIKHLGKIIQTLSYELIVLQDFLKGEHGRKFERFRRNYSNSEERPSQKQRTSISEKAGALERYESEDESKNSIGDVVFENGESIRDDKELSCSDNDDEMFSESDTSVTLKDPLDVDSNEARKGGRRKTKIWKYFDKVFHGNNKFSARCHVCQCLVSSRASRMVEHRLKCKRRVRIKVESKNVSVHKHVIKNHDIEAKTKAEKNDERETSQFSDNESFLCSDNDQSDKDKTHKNGRNLDTIWKYFEIIFQNDLKKAKCMSCGKFVSPKAVRMRQHKIGCTNEGQPHMSSGGD